MARDLEHLELRMWRQHLPRRRHGGGRPPQRVSSIHGRELLEQATAVAEHLGERLRTALSGINPRLLFKMQLHHGANLSDEDLGNMRLRVLARDGSNAIVVFPDEASLAEVRRRIREYAGLDVGHQYTQLAAIDAILELTPEDRKGVRLKESPLGENEIASLDVELWHGGDRVECQRRVEEITTLIRTNGLEVTDNYIGATLCLLRARVDTPTLGMLLEIDYIKEIDRRPQPTFEVADVVRMRRSDIQVETNLPQDLVGIVIIDSGVMQQHPVLRPCIADAQVFPDHMHERITGGAEDGDQTQGGGHGTSVAGIAAYNDIGECITHRVFEASALVFSARVTDDNNEYDENELIEHQLADAVEYFLRNYPAVRVFNISLGDSRLVYSDGSYQFRLAAAIDELAYLYRDRDIIFVISAGNYQPDMTAEEVVAQYPGYLLDSQSARVIDPATAGLALTVGGLSYGAGRDLHGYSEHGTERIIAQDRGWPSYFTRTGWGVDGAIKPELVDYAGDGKFERGRLRQPPVYAGLPSTNKSFAPPEGQLFRLVAGTSFAAPRVANLAARLFREFPRASSNLIRALIADSARVPEAQPPRLADNRVNPEEQLRIYGYGQPDFTRARWSSQNECLLVKDDTIAIDTFRLYEIPPLPEEFLTATGKGFLSVTLAFDPPTRHTRGDRYLGITMQFQLYRNVSAQEVADALRAWSSEEKSDDEDLPTLRTMNRTNSLPDKIDFKPGVQRRSKGTLQRGIAPVSGRSWQYNGEPLVLAVICQRKWAPADVVDQRFAVVVSVRHENPDVRIHAHMQQYVQVYERLRARV